MKVFFIKGKEKKLKEQFSIFVFRNNEKDLQKRKVWTKKNFQPPSFVVCG
jgi:hypothetical protein